MKPGLMVAMLLVVSAISAAEKDDVVLPRDPKTGVFMYQDVVALDGVPAKELYSRAKAWAAQAYKSAKDVIQLDDRDAGRLIVKGLISTSWMSNEVWVRHTVTIEVKEGRYRYTVTDFVFDTGHWTAPLEDEKRLKLGRQKLLARTATAADSLIAELKSVMASSSPVGSDAW